MNEEGRCPLCKTGVVKPAGRMVETHIAGITVRDGGGVVDTCSACGESFFPFEMMVAYETRAISLVLREVPDRVDGAVMRYARRVLGLKQAELAKLLGVTVTTIVRMEKAKLVDARMRTSMLWFLDEAQRGVDVRAQANARPKKSKRGKLTLVVKAA